MAISPRLSLAGPALDPLPIWRALRALALVSIAVCFVDISLNIIELTLPMAFEASAILLTLSWYLVYGQWFALLGAVALLWLTYRMARNLHALAPNKLSMSPTYAVAMFVVPVVSFFMPPLVIESIERETQVAADAETQKSAVIGWWWVACIFASLLGGVAQSLMANSGAFDPTAMFNGRAYEIALMTNIAGGVLAIGAWLLTMRIFGPLAELQSRLIRTRLEAARP